MRMLFAVCLSVGLASLCDARPVRYWPYKQLTEEADLIVIATPIKTEETGERINLPGIVRNNKPISAVGINTIFTVLAVLKGDNDLENLVFFHLREAKPPETARVNPPLLVSFDPKKKNRYLLFLKCETDGRFSSLTGQTDPAGAVKDLGIYP